MFNLYIFDNFSTALTYALENILQFTNGKIMDRTIEYKNGLFFLQKNQMYNTFKKYTNFFDV